MPVPTLSQFLGCLGWTFGFFRDKGLEVPSIALLLDLFSVKEDSYTFLSGPLPGLLFPTSLPPISTGKSYISLSGVDIGNTTLLTKIIR